VRAREDDLRALQRALHLAHEEAAVLLDRVPLVRRLFGPRQDAFGAAEVDDGRAHLEPDDLAVDDVALTLGVLAEDVLALGLAQALLDDLLHRLRADASEDLGALLDRDDLAELGVLAQRLCLGKRDLRLRVLDLVDGGLQHVDAHGARLWVDLHVEVLFGPVRALDRLPDDVGDDLLRQPLLGGQLGQTGHEFPVHVLPSRVLPLKMKKSGSRPTSRQARAEFWSG
jgi:hypothetical protein